jgi:hypothetical protein
MNRADVWSYTLWEMAKRFYLNEYEKEAVIDAKLENIVEYLDDNKLNWQVNPWGSFDFIELEIDEHVDVLCVGADNYVSFWTESGKLYRLEEDMMPSTFAEAQRFADGVLRLRFHPSDKYIGPE